MVKSLIFFCKFSLFKNYEKELDRFLFSFFIYPPYRISHDSFQVMVNSAQDALTTVRFMLTICSTQRYSITIYGKKDTIHITRKKAFQLYGNRLRVIRTYFIFLINNIEYGREMGPGNRFTVWSNPSWVMATWWLPPLGTDTTENITFPQFLLWRNIRFDIQIFHVF